MKRLYNLSSALKNENSESSTQITKKILQQKLFSIDLINKNVNRTILSMAYSPGVGAVCEAIHKNPQLADKMTMRGRSVAIVTDGSFLGAQGKSIQPVMDWLIVQIKYYSGIDAFPFVIKKGANIKQILRDLETCYGSVLLMDDYPTEESEVPENLLVVKQKSIMKILNSTVTDLQKTAHILAYFLKNNQKGLLSAQHLPKGIAHEASNFSFDPPYGVQTKDGRDVYQHSLQLHQFYQGKIQIELHFHDINKIKPFFTEAKLKKLVKQSNVFSNTRQLSSIVTDGTAILGLGNIGPKAGLPVMEGKSLLFKLLGDVQVVPVCIYPRKTTEEQIQAITNIAGNFNAINLEDIKAPQCFDVELGLQKLKLMPVFHDDQHGTAIVILAGLINAVKVVDKNLQDCRVIINGAGAAGITLANFLLDYGVKDVIICDTAGAIYEGRQKNMNHAKNKIAQRTNRSKKVGNLEDVIEGTDIFVGVSKGNALKGQWVAKMSKKSIVFALANPYPEIMPEEAKKNGAFIYGSGRSNLQNQINNSLVFPGIFRAIMEHKIEQITQQMQIKASEAIAASLTQKPHQKNIIPDTLDKDVAIRISRELGRLKKI